MSGKAKDKIESLDTTEINYTVAWSLLEKYYNDPVAIINNRIKAIFELPLCYKANAQSIGDLLDNAEKHYRALKALDTPFLEAFPIYTIVSKLDEQTRVKWKETRQETNTVPTIDELFDFLHKRQKVLETPKNDKLTHDTNIRKTIKSVQSYTVTTKIICKLCKADHYTQNCEKLKSANVDERYEIIKNAKLCFNCLRSNHSVQNCNAKRCKQCNGKHHSILHRERIEISKMEAPSTSQSNVACLNTSLPIEVLLSTAIVNVEDKYGKNHTCRILLDSGSQSNFITNEFAKKLNLPFNQIDIPVTGINRTISYCKNSVETKIKSRINDFSAKLTLIVLNQCPASMPSQHIVTSTLNIPVDIKLTDTEFYKSRPIDALIGAELFYKLLCIGQIKLGNHGAMLQKTVFGWVISGRLSNNQYR